MSQSTDHEHHPPADPELFGLVEAAVGHPGFWASAPAWRPDAARQPFDGGLAVWSDAGLFTVAQVPSAVAVHLDGVATLDALAEDLAAAVEGPLDWARTVVATLAVELTRLQAVDGVALPDDPSAGVDGERDAPTGEPGDDGPELGESYRLDPDTGEQVRVVTTRNAEGHLVETTFLPDGLMRMSTTMTLSTDGPDGGLAVAEALAGDRSPAELVPPDSCLGSKLRDREDVPLVSIRCDDDRIRSVRCHDPKVESALRDLAGDRLVEGHERGPVVAFVVTPLEGQGPVRIYDGRGARRGRPRTAGEAADVVDQLLGENQALDAGCDSSALIPLDAALAHRGGEGLLVPLGLLTERELRNELIEQGWVISHGRAGLEADGSLATPSASGTGVRMPAGAVRVIVPMDAQSGPASNLRYVVLGGCAEFGGRHAALERVRRFAEVVRPIGLQPSGPGLGDHPTP